MSHTKEAFMHHYKDEVLRRYAWAQDAAKLERFMGGVAETLNGPASIWSCEGAAVDAAWDAIGGKGRPTLKKLRALEAGERVL